MMLKNLINTLTLRDKLQVLFHFRRSTEPADRILCQVCVFGLLIYCVCNLLLIGPHLFVILPQPYLSPLHHIHTKLNWIHILIRTLTLPTTLNLLWATSDKSSYINFALYFEQFQTKYPKREIIAQRLKELPKMKNNNRERGLKIEWVKIHGREILSSREGQTCNLKKKG